MGVIPSLLAVVYLLSFEVSSFNDSLFEFASAAPEAGVIKGRLGVFVLRPAVSFRLLTRGNDPTSRVLFILCVNTVSTGHTVCM